MTPEQAQMVRLSFIQVMDRKLETGTLFYDRLFTIAPDVRPLFKGDMEAQAAKLMDTLSLAIAQLKDSATLVRMLEGLAVRHVGYGVKDEHYDQVGAALIWTLERGLGGAFTAELRDAWVALYTTAAGVMRNAAKGVPAQRASA